MAGGWGDTTRQDTVTPTRTARMQATYPCTRRGRAEAHAPTDPT